MIFKQFIVVDDLGHATGSGLVMWALGSLWGDTRLKPLQSLVQFVVLN